LLWLKLSFQPTLINNFLTINLNPENFNTSHFFYSADSQKFPLSYNLFLTKSSPKRFIFNNSFINYFFNKKIKNIYLKLFISKKKKIHFYTSFYKNINLLGFFKNLLTFKKSFASRTSKNFFLSSNSIISNSFYQTLFLYNSKKSFIFNLKIKLFLNLLKKFLLIIRIFTLFKNFFTVKILLFLFYYMYFYLKTCLNAFKQKISFSFFSLFIYLLTIKNKYLNTLPAELVNFKSFHLNWKIILILIQIPKLYSKINFTQKFNSLPEQFFLRSYFFYTNYLK
jgi:hypothetical protein